uniref:Uncharacterized protein n=1 Tax=Panagrolaimus sp. JU765 TaxID=591449 RepID=A0AC34QPX8_9BILA
MPGEHTFYDGSRILEPLASTVGVEADKLNLVFCQMVSIAAAHVFYRFFPPNRTPPRTRQAFLFIVGLSLCFFCFGRAIKHLFGLIVVCYGLMRLAPSPYVHKAVFLFSMGYLTFIHWYRWYILTAYYIDVTGPMMVLVQKTTTLAFSLHDGTVKKPEELNEIQKREAIRKPPDVLEYLAYMFSFQTILTGPSFFYTDFQRFISGENLKINGKEISRPQKPYVKFMFAGVCLVLLVFVSPSMSPEIITEEPYKSMGVISWSLLWFFVIFLQRVQYYYVWVLADAICNLSGFGFNGLDDEGNQRWDLVTNVHPVKVEMALSFKDTLDNWNCTTMYWLRRVAYDRVPKNLRTVSTYLLSAMWHGLFLGYYITFLTGALVTVAARITRRCLRWRFQGSAFSARFYDVLTFFATKFALAYTTFPFVTLHLNPGLQTYKETYFCLHIICLFGIFALPKILPPEKKREDKKVLTDPVYGMPVNGTKKD